MNDVAQLIGEILDRPVTRTEGPARPGDIRDSWADITAARKTLGWEPEIGLEDGLRRTADLLLS